MCVLFCDVRYAAAEEDCSTSLSLDPTYVKAYSRRGMARLARKALAEAQEDFQQVLKIEPGNKNARAELIKIDKVNI